MVACESTKRVIWGKIPQSVVRFPEKRRFRGRKRLPGIELARDFADQPEKTAARNRLNHNTSNDAFVIPAQ
ncbi:MAG: hypothetical protein R3C40_00260 [Parvularculaceae bacterium]